MTRSLTEDLWPEIVFRVRECFEDPSPLFLVGGVVRDVLKRIPLRDIDLVIEGEGREAARHLANRFKGAYYPVDPERDTGRAIITFKGQRMHIDITRVRGETLEEDLRAREFTVNAMAVNLADLASIIDPLDGFADLFQRKVLRLPRQDSIESDPIRALRGVRHALNFHLRMLPETKEAIRRGASLLSAPGGGLLQKERCRDEFFKLISLDQPVDSALRVADSLGLLQVLLPAPPSDISAAISKAGWLQRLIRLVSPYRTDNDANNIHLAVAVMILDRNRAKLQQHFWQVFGEGRERWQLLILDALAAKNASGNWKQHFHLSREEDRILKVLGDRPAQEMMKKPLTDRDIHLFFREHGDAGVDSIFASLACLLEEKLEWSDPIAWGDQLNGPVAAFLDTYCQRYDTVIAPRPLLDGHAIKKCLPGIQGRLIGDFSQQLIEAQAAGEIATRSAARDYIRQLYRDVASDDGRLSC